MHQHDTPRITLALALSLSLAVHGLVIALWPSAPEPVTFVSGKGLTVSLRVEADKPAADGRQTTAAQEKVPVLATTPPPAGKSVIASAAVREARPVHAAIHATAAPDKPRAAAATTTVAAPPSGATAPAQAAPLAHHDSHAIQQHLRNAFQGYFYYPRLAIRRGWHGEVRLGLRIEANGTLSRIRILRGSGHSLLDDAAMQSLARVEALPSAVSLLHGRSLDVVLPVEYRLL